MKRFMKITTEMASLPSLEVHWDAYILVRTDETSIDFMRALISGPADTPYACGLWQFDIHLPASYPDTSPSVKFMTTGGGQARLNPNLYADGKVCLSLLGTWQGPGWVPGTSTLLQVLLSIQSQIMCDTPFGNEPSFEAQLALPSGKRAVAKHNTMIRLATIRYAMVEQLKTPKAGFKRATSECFWRGKAAEQP